MFWKKNFISAKKPKNLNHAAVENLSQNPTNKSILVEKEVSFTRVNNIFAYLKRQALKNNSSIIVEVKLVRRFCASSGMNADEQKCVYTMSQGRWTELCVCGDSLCNSAKSHANSALLLLTSFLLLISFIHHGIF